MNNYDDKIVSIKNNQKKLLELIKVKINEESDIFNINTKNIVDVLTHDNSVIKKYEAVIEAQKLIEKYTEEIKNAKTVDEIKDIRKRLNTCINKIKKEMKERFDDIEFNNYCEDVKRYRKRISENIRYLKRYEKINEIENLNSNISSLNEEDTLRLKKLVKNEMSYGKRNIEKLGSTVDNNENVNTNANTNLSMISNPMLTMDFESYDSLQDFLNCRVDFYERQYNVEKNDEYNGSIIKNISIFNKNLPKLINNKRRVKCMIRDYHLFVRKPELLGYSNYLKNSNSLRYNLKNVIKNGVLKNKEKSLEEEHNKAVNWIINFCNDNDLEIRYNKRVSQTI